MPETSLPGKAEQFCLTHQLDKTEAELAFSAQNNYAVRLADRLENIGYPPRIIGFWYSAGDVEAENRYNNIVEQLET